MKLDKTLRALTAAVALMAAAPSAQAARKMTDDQRACVARVLEHSTSTDADVQACLAAEAGGGNPENAKKELAPDSLEAQTLFATLEARFSKPSPARPAVVKFADVKSSLEARPDLLFSLSQMEKTGGQPDVIAVEGNNFVFADVSAESPEGRRNLPYRDPEGGQDIEKMVREMGEHFSPMDEATYRKLQKILRLDSKTVSYLFTDEATLATGGALHGDRLGDYAYVDRGWANYRSPDYGFRGLLRLPRSAKGSLSLPFRK